MQRVPPELSANARSLRTNATPADAQRTAYLAAQGWTVLRFWNNDVLANSEAVVEAILTIVARLNTHPNRSLSGRG